MNERLCVHRLSFSTCSVHLYWTYSTYASFLYTAHTSLRLTRHIQHFICAPYQQPQPCVVITWIIIDLSSICYYHHQPLLLTKPTQKPFNHLGHCLGEDQEGLERVQTQNVILLRKLTPTFCAHSPCLRHLLVK